MILVNRCFVLLLCVFTLLFWQPKAASSRQTQQKPSEQNQPVKIKTELIQIRAVVTDKSGRVIDGLKQEEFEVLENGKPQSTEFFSIESVGTSSGGIPPGAAPSATAAPRNPAAAAAAKPDRFIAAFVDTQHLSFTSLNRVKQALRRFVNEQITEQDVVAIIPSGGSSGILSQFTRDRQILRLAIDKLIPWQPQIEQPLFSPYLAARVASDDKDAINAAIVIERAEHPEEMDTPLQAITAKVRGRANALLAEVSFKRRATLFTLKAVVDQMASLPGQRLVFLLSDGFTLGETGGGRSETDLLPVISRAARSGVTISAFDAKGLQPTMLSAEQSGAAVVRQLASQNEMSAGSDVSRFLSLGERDLELGMQDLAAETGGESFFGTNDLNGRLQKALDNNRVYYVLAYYPPSEEAPAKLRKITVRVKGHPEYTVRTQKGYIPAELARLSEEKGALTVQQRLLRAMASPVPLTALGLSVSVDYFERENDPKTVFLQTHIEGDNLDYREENQRFNFELQVATAIFDVKGKQVYGSSDEVKGELQAEQVTLAKRNGLKSPKWLPLQPGLYQVRVAAFETNTQRLGSALAWIEVPRLEQKKLTISSLLLPEPATGAAASHLKQGIRYYRDGGALTYFMRVYPPAAISKPETEILMQTQIVQNERTLYQSDWMPLAERLATRDKAGLEITQDLTVSNVKPGVYELRVLIKEAKAKQPLQRTVLFGVER